MPDRGRECWAGAEEGGCGGDYALGRGLWHNDTVTLRFGGALSRSLGRGTERAGAVVPTRRAHCLHPKFLGETTPVAVKIKLKRMGKIHAPFYRIIVADARTKRDGRAIEEIGKYHPKNEPSLIEVNSERAQHWLSVGAQPTDPVRKILEITGDWQKFKGLPGTEGTLRSAAPKADKKDAFAAAVAETLGDAGKGKGSGPAKAGAGKPAAKAGGKQPAAKADTAKADTATADTARRHGHGRHGHGGHGHGRHGHGRHGHGRHGHGRHGHGRHGHGRHRHGRHRHG